MRHSQGQIEEVTEILESLEERGYVYSYVDRGERRWALTEKGWLAKAELDLVGLISRP
jgi:DNA-binding MarR family transcriptional regulator